MKTRVILLSICLGFFLNLTAINIQLENDKLISGKFVELSDHTISVLYLKTLYNVSPEIITTIIDNNRQTVNLENFKKHKVNYNKIKEEIILTAENFQKETQTLYKMSDFVKVWLENSDIYYGFLVGNDGQIIVIYNTQKNENYMIKKEAVLKITNFGEDCTTAKISETLRLNETDLGKCNIINLETEDLDITNLSDNLWKKSIDLSLGVDFGITHILYYTKAEKSIDFHVNPSPYLKVEFIKEKNYIKGYGIAFQPYKIIDHSSASCTFIPVYLIFATSAKPLGVEVNFGANLYLGNERYRGVLHLIPGGYFALGASYKLNNNYQLELFYTLNHGITRYIHAFNQSISLGLKVNFTYL